MTDKKILVLGATGPSGILILRELVYRNHATIAYVRNPGKVPADLVHNPLLEIVEGQMDDVEKVNKVVARTSAVLSILGPISASADPLLYRGYYSTLLTAMKRHGVKRILAMSTLSAGDSMDSFSLVANLLVFAVRLFANSARLTMLEIADVFQKEGQGLDWTVYRIPFIWGDGSAESWAKNRELGEAYAGPIGGRGWKVSLPRAVLAKWLVDSAEGKHDEWIGKMPALSLRA
ncbi:hypothetical protein S40293_06377 [Stachybotrys chartarum IBT 40293]|nr:hypothetical protein S40293_06377 [Stachybotrys chartarum IBT 40293]KFA80700.1 hypothetical protein S40288_01764 [Stachybotrys chartarum IBT 40288]